MEEVEAILDEAFKETVGASSKKWAVVLVAVVAGALGAFWLVRRARSSEPAAAPVDRGTT